MTINSTKSESTGYTPHETLYGRLMNLPESIINQPINFPINQPT